MNKLFTCIIRHRAAVLIITAVITALCIFSMFQTNINSDMAKYLDKDSITKQTMQFLVDNFDINGDAAVCVEGSLDDYDQIGRLVSQLSSVDNVDAVLWLGSYGPLFTVTDGEIVSSDEMISTDKVRSIADDYYKTEDGRGYYLFSVALAESNASKESSEAMDSFADILADYAHKYSSDYYLGGTVMQGKNMLDSALGELPKFLIIAVIVIAVILLLTSKSLVSALIFLLTIGISIALNMGTNFFTDSVSTVTFSVAAILQLALSMDYSIFLTHAYEREQKAGNPKALLSAIKKTAVVILASALTTVAGFCALFFMKYEMGFDMGLCLAKGVSLSFITVIIVQPCLMTVLDRACKKTEHKVLHPSFEKYSRIPYKARWAALVISIVLLVPSVILATGLDYYYLDTDYSENSTGAKRILDSDGSQMIFVVPLKDNDTQFGFLNELKRLEGEGRLTKISGYYSLADTLLGGVSIPIYADASNPSEEDLLTTVELTSADVLAMVESGGQLSDEQTAKLTETITSAVSSAAPALIEQKIASASYAYGRVLTESEQALVALETANQLKEQISAQLTAQLSSCSEQLTAYSEMVETMRSGFISDVDGTEYTYYTVSVAGAAESGEAVETVEDIESIIHNTFGDDASYRAAGSTQTVRDLAEATKKDFVVVSIVSAALILIILVITFRTLLLPLLMVAVIELAILLNMSISALSGSSINFMTYVVISAIQLGATIDYAILLVKNYRLALPASESPAEAVAQAIKNSAFSILISMFILSGACLSVYFVSSDKIIREITMMIARGAAISAVLVLFILPALLSLKKNKRLGI